MFDIIFLIICALGALALFIIILAAVRNYNTHQEAKICPFCDTTFAGSFCNHCGCPEHEAYQIKTSTSQ